MSQVENILARNKQLENEGIPEPERDRALIAEFEDPVIADDIWTNQPQENVLPKLTLKIPDTGYPPKVMDRVDIPGPFDNDGFDHKNPDPQGFAGGRNLEDLSQYKTNAPENKVIKSQLVYDPMYDAISNDPNSEPSMHGEYGFNVAKAIPEWRYDVEQDQGGVRELDEGGPGSGCHGPNCGRKPGGTPEEWTQGLQSRGVAPEQIELELMKADELINNGGQMNTDGTVTLYHRTTPEAKAQIQQTGQMIGLENGVFFSTSNKPGGSAEDFGTAILTVDVPLEILEIDDLFGDEAHVRIPTTGPGASVDVSDYNLRETMVHDDKSLPQVLDHAREEYLQRQSDGYIEMPHVVVAPPEMPDEPHVVVEQEALEPLWGKYHLGPKHPRSDICDKFQMKVYDLNIEKNRPVPPSEGLGWTNTHPNCQCYWLIIKQPSKTAKATKPQIKQFQKINRLIGQKARYGTLHKVHADGKLYKTMTHKNVREALMEIRDEFSWLQPQYLDKIKAINAPGRMYLIRASEEAITDHRGEGEPLRRWLSPDELHAMARTAVKKGMDINHHPEWRTNSEVLDSEYDKMLKQIQMIVYEEDQEINDAIQRGDITAVSINGGSPRNESIQCPACQSSTNCECFIVPEGVILGEADDIALTWVVTNPTGIMWHGQFIPPATPGVKTTAIEPL